MRRSTRSHAAVRPLWCLALTGLLAACGATLDSFQFTGDTGSSTTSFTVNTAGTYRVALFATGPNNLQLCVITATLYQGSDSITMTALSTNNVALPGTVPKYFSQADEEENHQLTTGTWAVTATAQCPFEITVGDSASAGPEVIRTPG